MSESNKNFRDSHHRGAKNSHFASRRSDTPETGFHAQGTASPGQNTGLNSPRSPHPNNNHIQNYYNSRNPAARGRNRGEGGYHDRGNYRGYQNTGPSRVISPTNPEIPNYHELVGFMFQAWQDYSTEYYGKRGEEPPSFTNPSLSSQPPAQTSPRVSTHVNSPHRGQSYRFSHQNSSGGNWSGNSNAGVYGRKHSDNGEHSNTGSLRRHHNGHRGGNHASSPAFSSNQQWQRGNFANRQNSPNNNLNRPGGPRHSNYHPNHRPNPTSSPAAVAGVVGSISQPIDAEQTTTTTTVAEDETAQLAEEVQALSLQRSAESPPPNNGQKKIVTNKTPSSIDSPEEATATSPGVFGKEKEPSYANKKEAVAVGEEPIENRADGSVPPLSRAESASTTPSSSTTTTPTAAHAVGDSVEEVAVKMPTTRRRAATTQGETETSPLPTKRASESASMASSSFCSLVDQVDAMSATDQFYTPEPPSSPTNGTVDDTAAPVSPPARVKE